MSIHSNNDLFRQEIDQFTFQATPDKLVINGRLKNIIYQTEILAGTTQRTIQEYQTFLDQHDYEYLSHDFETFKLISYDVSFTLTNKDILTLNQLKQQKDQIYDQICQLKDELFIKQSELQKIKEKITAIEEDLLKKFFESENKLKANQRKKINKFTQLELQVFPKLMVTFPNLRYISLYDNKITDAGLRTLAEHADKFKNLNWILLNYNKITDAGLMALAEHGDKFKNLKEINLSNNKIKDAGFRALTEHGDKFKSLKKIFLNKIEITDASLKAVAEHAQKFINLNGIYLFNNKITDEGLKAILAKYKLEFQIYT